MDDKQFVNYYQISLKQLCEVATKFSQFFTHMNEFCNRYIQQNNGGPPMINGALSLKPSFLSPMPTDISKPKGRRRSERDRRAPKKIRSAYNFFCQQRRTKLLEKNPRSNFIQENQIDLTFQELSKLLGTEWHNLSEQKKKQFQYISDQDKIRYTKEQSKYEKEKGLPPTHLTNFRKKQKTNDFAIRSRIPSPKLVEQISIDDDDDEDSDNNEHTERNIVEIQDNDDSNFNEMQQINSSDEQLNEVSESQLLELDDSLDDFQYQNHQHEMIKKIKMC